MCQLHRLREAEVPLEHGSMAIMFRAMLTSSAGAALPSNSENAVAPSAFSSMTINSGVSARDAASRATAKSGAVVTRNCGRVRLEQPAEVIHRHQRTGSREGPAGYHYAERRNHAFD
jgi:hypothetical protein